LAFINIATAQAGETNNKAEINSLKQQLQQTRLLLEKIEARLNHLEQ